MIKHLTEMRKLPCATSRRCDSCLKLDISDIFGLNTWHIARWQSAKFRSTIVSTN